MTAAAALKAESASPVLLSGDESDLDILNIARGLAAEFAATAAERDRTQRRSPHELSLLASSGLLALRNPPQWGGRLYRPSVIVEATRIIATGDSSLAQIIQNHYVPIEVLTHWGYPAATQERLFGEAAAGAVFATASAPKTTGAHVGDTSTTLKTDGSRVLSGSKYFVTGGFGSRWLFVIAKGEDAKRYRLLVPTSDPGVEVLDDWDAIGQRGTGSGTVIFHDVVVPSGYFVPTPPVGASWYMPFTQAIHSAVLVGLARAAFEDGVRFISGRGPDAKGSRRSADPFVAAGIGIRAARVHAAEALLASAGLVLDEVDALGGHKAPTPDYDRAHVAALEARIIGAEVALDVAQAVFELGGAHSALSETGLDRHWRNARTHSLQRPLNWVNAGIGSFYLDGSTPTFKL